MAAPSAVATPFNPQKAVGLHFQNGRLLSPLGGSGGAIGGGTKFSFQPQGWNGPVNNNGMRVIGGYQGNGIQTDQFQQQFGRAPTASDYERRFGGLSPEHNQIGSLDDFYARNTVDPNTGLALMPSANERMQQRAMLQRGDKDWSLGANNKAMNDRFANKQGGDFEGLSAVDSYYGARATGDPMMQQAAAQNLQNFKTSRGFLQSVTGQNPLTQGPTSPTSSFQPIHATNDIMPQGPQFQAGPTTSGGINYSTGQGLAKGGPAAGMHPYQVGEKGDEVWQGVDGRQELIGVNGPEIRTFDEPGRVIPHNMLPKRLQLMSGAKGNGNPMMKQEMDVPGRWVGGPTQASNYDSTGFDGVLRDFGMLPPQQKRQQLQTPASGFGHPGLSPMTRMDDPSLQQVEPADLPVAAQYDWTPPDYTALQMAPVGAQPVEQPLQLPAGISPHRHATAPPPPVPFYSQIASNAAQGVAALPVQQAMVQSRMAPLGATALSPVGATTQSFGTPYGTASVNFAPVNRESTIGGLPASEFFQREANAQGESNKYAKPEEGYVKPAARYREQLQKQVRAAKVEKENKGLKFS